MEKSMDAPNVISIRSDLDIIAARMAAREAARKMGFSTIDQARIATATSELSRNILTYAKEGNVSIREVHANNRHGIQIVFEDHGPGIADSHLPQQDNHVGNTDDNGMGLGLAGSHRLMDQLDIETTVGIGTRIICHKWRR